MMWETRRAVTILTALRCFCYLLVADKSYLQRTHKCQQQIACSPGCILGWYRVPGFPWKHKTQAKFCGPLQNNFVFMILRILIATSLTFCTLLTCSHPSAREALACSWGWDVLINDATIQVLRNENRTAEICFLGLCSFRATVFFSFPAVSLSA